MFNNMSWLLFFRFINFLKKAIIVELIATRSQTDVYQTMHLHDTNTWIKYSAYLTLRVIDASEFFARQRKLREKEGEMKRDRDGIAK